jgi:putative membrane protein
MPPVISDVDLERIRAAVAEAEQRTAGEIVPYVVSRSGRYEIALWRGAVAGGVLTMVATIIALQAYAGWGLGWAYSAWGMAMMTAAGGAMGAALPYFWPAARRALVGRGRLAERVHRRAEAAFVEEEVFNTRNRTGILLFVSLFEHRIEVIGDAGINEAVPKEAWHEVVDLIRAGIVRGSLADGLVAAVDRCGRLLEECGVASCKEGVDELPDAVRLRAR